MLRLLLVIAAILFPTALADEPPKAREPQPTLFVGYDPSPAWPHGRQHPDAAPELAQFAFMIGAFDCIDGIRNPDGSWREFPATWNANYFLNGHGIQDQYWAPTFATSNIRIYDRNAGLWKVTFFKKPGYASGVWSGRQEDGKMVMRKESTRPDGTSSVSRLTFYNIGPDGFDWVSENVTGDTATAGWRSSCKRRSIPQSIP